MGHSTHLRYWNARSRPRVDQTFLFWLSFNVEGYECKKMNAIDAKLNVMLKIECKMGWAFQRLFRFSRTVCSKVKLYI